MSSPAEVLLDFSQHISYEEFYKTLSELNLTEINNQLVNIDYLTLFPSRKSQGMNTSNHYTIRIRVIYFKFQNKRSETYYFNSMAEAIEVANVMLTAARTNDDPTKACKHILLETLITYQQYISDPKVTGILPQYTREQNPYTVEVDTIWKCISKWDTELRLTVTETTF